MDRMERVAAMERHMNEAASALAALDSALTAYEAALPAFAALETYYDADWRDDFAADEAGELPPDLPRGVLSEDGLWNLLEEAREVRVRMTALCGAKEG